MTQSHILEHSSKAREVRRFAAMVSLFVGMFMCLGAPAARAPGATTQTNNHAVNTGAAVKPGRELGASDLFTALTEPDRNGEIDALRAIRRELTSPDDPRARDAARDHLDALLDLEERRQPEVPPALVMNSLAARIDNAIAGLEQTSHSGSAPPDAPEMHQTVLSLVTALLAALAAAAGLDAAIGGRRRFLRTKAEFREGLNSVRRLLESAAAGTSCVSEVTAASTAEIVMAAARDVSVAASHVTHAASDADMHLRACLELFDVRQHQAAEMAGEAERVLQNLPHVLAGAIEAMTARGLEDLEPVTQKLEALSQDNAASTAGLSAAIEDFRNAAPTLKAVAERTESIENAVLRIEVVAEALPQISEALTDFGLLSTRDGQGDPADRAPNTSLGRASTLGDALERANDLVGLLAEVAASFATSAAELRRETQLSNDAMANIHEQFGRSAQKVEAACDAVSDCSSRLNNAAIAQAATADTADTLAETANLIKTESNAIAAGIRQDLSVLRGLYSETSELHQSCKAITAEQRAQLATLGMLVRNVDGALKSLPLEITRLNEIAVVLSAGASEMIEAAARLAVEGERLAASAAVQTEAGWEASREVARLTTEIPAAAVALTDAARRSEADLGRAVSCILESASAITRNMQQRELSLDAMVCRADAALAGLPIEAAQLAGAAATLQQEVALILHAMHQLESSVAEQGAVGVRQAVNQSAQFDLISHQIADTLAGLGGTALTIREEAVALTQRVGSVADATELATQRLSAVARDSAERSAEAAERGTAEAALLRAAMVEQNDRLFDVLAQVDRLYIQIASAKAPGVPNADIRLAELEVAVAKAIDNAIQLSHHSEISQQAAEKATQSAFDLIDAAAQQTPMPTLAWLEGLANQTKKLLEASGGVAEAALRGDLGNVPPDVLVNIPDILRSIERSIDGLRGTATALALAGDTARLAA